MADDKDCKQQTLTTMIEREPHRLTTRIGRIIRDEISAEDLAQEALLRALRSLASVGSDGGEARMCAWLDRIARNLAYNHIRDTGRRPVAQPLDDQFQSKEPDPAQACVSADTRTHLFTLIQGLPSGLREVFLLREQEGLSTAQTAAMLEIGEGLVKWRLHRAKQLLRQTLEL
jgi:RNA polymerase sigma-70 factor, ECF subfamily